MEVASAEFWEKSVEYLRSYDAPKMAYFGFLEFFFMKNHQNGKESHQNGKSECAPKRQGMRQKKSFFRDFLDSEVWFASYRVIWTWKFLLRIKIEGGRVGRKVVLHTPKMQTDISTRLFLAVLVGGCF